MEQQLPPFNGRIRYTSSGSQGTPSFFFSVYCGVGDRVTEWVVPHPETQRGLERPGRGTSVSTCVIVGDTLIDTTIPCRFRGNLCFDSLP